MARDARARNLENPRVDRERVYVYKKGRPAFDFNTRAALLWETVTISAFSRRSSLAFDARIVEEIRKASRVQELAIRVSCSATSFALYALSGLSWESETKSPRVNYR